MKEINSIDRTISVKKDVLLERLKSIVEVAMEHPNDECNRAVMRELYMLGLLDPENDLAGK